MTDLLICGQRFSLALFCCFVWERRESHVCRGMGWTSLTQESSTCPLKCIHVYVFIPHNILYIIFSHILVIKVSTLLTACQFKSYKAIVIKTHSIVLWFTVTPKNDGSLILLLIKHFTALGWVARARCQSDFQKCINGTGGTESTSRWLSQYLDVSFFFHALGRSS